jgi:hypothetical protein
MRRGLALLLAITSAVFADNKTNNPDPGSFDVEPPLLIPDRDAKPIAESKAASDSEPLDLAKLEKQFERARQSAASAERFCKIGALSRVEAEQRELRFVRLESDLANAKLAQAKEEMLTKQRADSGIATANLRETESALALAIERAHSAVVRRQRAELEAAEANIDRQKKLLALGSARKADVARAEQKLAELRARQNQ